MKSITIYKEKIADLLKKIGEMRQACINESRDPSIEEIELQNDMMDEIERIETIIKTEERKVAITEKISKPEERKTTPPDTKTNHSMNDQEKRDSFMTFGEQMQSVMRAGMANGFVDPKLREVERRATGMSATVPSDGGFLIQPQFANELLKVAFETGKLGRLCRQIPMQSNSLKIPGLDETSRIDGSRQGGIRAYWADEASTKTASAPKFRMLEFNAHKLIGLVYATDELLDDAPALEAYLRQGFADEFGFKVDDAIINGTGAGQPLGILNAGCMVSFTRTTTSTVKYLDVIGMWARLLSNAKADSVWLMNPDVFPQLAQMSLTVSSGGSAVYIPPGGASASPYGSLMGRPIIECEQCASMGTVNDLILANFRMGYILCQRGGLQSDMSIHVKFVQDESCFRFVLRLDGQPMLRSAITPYKGSNTQSHFINIAT